MNILTLADSHTATAALFCDDQLEACASEERFTRGKCEIGYPRQAINYCLSMLGGRSIDHVIVMGKKPPDPFHYRTSFPTTFSLQDIIDLQYEYYKPLLIDCIPAKEVYRKYFKSLYEKRTFPNAYEGMDTMEWAYDSDIDKNKFREIQVNTVVKHLNIAEEKIIFIEHHPAHAAYAYFASPFR